MSKFSIPKRYDAAVAEEGVWFEIADEAGQEYGSFKCRYLDELHPRTEVITKRVKTQFATKKGRKADEWEVLKTIMVECVLLDWKVNDMKGKPVPFTKADALEYFSEIDTRYCLIALSRLSGDVTNFGTDMPVEVIEKN